MAQRNLALLFVVPNCIGASSPKWPPPAVFSRLGDASDRIVTSRPTWPPPTGVVSRLGDSSNQKATECGERCDVNGADCTDPDHPCFRSIDTAQSANTPSRVDDDDQYDANGCYTSWTSDGYCDFTNNNEQCGYDGGDCCICDCEDETTFFTCGPYDCIDPSSACVDDDDSSVSWSDSECADETWACFFDAECFECLTSGTSSTEDDAVESCPISSGTCSDYAGFYCCAIEADMDEGCEDNSELIDYIGCIHIAFEGDDCGFGSFCDYTGDDDSNDISITWEDDDLAQCEDEILGCFYDQDCFECMMSGSSSSSSNSSSSSSPEEDEDDVLESCPISSDTCSGYADFYCCAIETDMNEGCEDNSELLDYLNCLHTVWQGDDCEFDSYSFCDYDDFSAALTSCGNPSIAAAFGVAVAGLVAAAAAVFL